LIVCVKVLWLPVRQFVIEICGFLKVALSLKLLRESKNLVGFYCFMASREPQR